MMKHLYMWYIRFFVEPRVRYIIENFGGAPTEYDTISYALDGLYDIPDTYYWDRQSGDFYLFYTNGRVIIKGRNCDKPLGWYERWTLENGQSWLWGGSDPSLELIHEVNQEYRRCKRLEPSLAFTKKYYKRHQELKTRMLNRK